MPVTTILSDFENGIDGWTALGAGVQLFHQASGGHPGGHIQILDDGLGGALAFFSAPAKFLGNKSDFIGGQLDFSLFFTAPLPSVHAIRLVGDGLTIRTNLSSGFGDDGEWNNESNKVLLPDYWVLGSRTPTAEEFQRVMSNLTQILILAEFDDDFGAGGEEETRLDNFKMTSPDIPTDLAWERYSSSAQTNFEGEFNTFAQAMAGASAGDFLLFANPDELALDLNRVNIGIDDLTVSGGALLDGTFKLSSAINRFTLDGDTFSDVIGNGRDNVLTGNDSGNTLKGNGGNDTLIGRGGDDRLLVDDAGDSVVEIAGGGDDVVFASVNYTLAADADIEWLRADGLGLVLTGNGLAQRIDGGDGDDTLEGGGGADSLRGRTGNDTYIIRDLSASIVETAGAGHDIAVVWVNDYVLDRHVEELHLAGLARRATGSKSDNLMQGSEFDDVLKGGKGNDTLIGGEGRDELVGGADNDTLYAAPGDTLIGGEGDDTYVIGLYHGASFDPDTPEIRDFNRHTGDVDRFAFIGSDFGLPAGPLGPDRIAFGRDYRDADEPSYPDDGTAGRFVFIDRETEFLVCWDDDGVFTGGEPVLAILKGQPHTLDNFIVI